MKNKIFTLRVDLESDKGIKEGLPKLLNLLKKYDLKASFYLVIGGESNFLELIKHRGGMKSSGERKIKLWRTKEKLRMALLPRDFAKKNISILKRILDEGHELGLHGWKHREWTRGLNKIDVPNRIKLCKIKYKSLFGKSPISFASPGFNINEKVLKLLENEGITFISDFQDKKVEKYGKIKNIPMTILGKNKMPIIEFLVEKRKKDDEIINEIKKKINGNKICSFYIHGLFEARFKLRILEEIFKYVKNKKILNKRVMDY